MSPLSTIPPTIARSWLLLPADKSERFDAAVSSEMDVVVLDVEDGCRQSEKERARREVRQWLEAGNHAWIRINDVRSSEWEKDLMALGHCPGLDGVMLAKTENPEHISLTAARLAENTPIVALVESADGLAAAAEIAKTDQVVRLAFGVGDFRRDTGIGSSQIALAYTRSQFVVASRIARVAPPIDGPTISNDTQVLMDAAEHAVEMGMTGKLCLRVDQAPYINEVLSPSAADVSWAESVIDELGPGGERCRDGADLPRLARAQKIAHLAQAYAVTR
ncbi:CoA ester lyase [Dietzia sp. PP-33]|jgi:citrate lyase subunit beta/citryl-CoA lyase|uniref:HpcH/HpaI aldolase/citrate lyase family protein n=1 Tax=Dietzia sp. PP-33 TaxID=2957500 RepID=UPI0029A7615E|nr:CoA ester lyase [Dietzia sp. PP-33]MDX2358086.1 CoA ester lyase [Dietzia sp. PP-33]